MPTTSVKSNKNKWMKEIFNAQSVEEGNVVRRSLESVEKIVGLKELEEEVRKKRYHKILTGNQCVIMCNKGDFRVVC